MAIFVGKPKRLLAGLFGRYFNTYFADSMNNFQIQQTLIQTQLSLILLGQQTLGYFVATLIPM